MSSQPVVSNSSLLIAIELIGEFRVAADLYDRILRDAGEAPGRLKDFDYNIRGVVRMAQGMFRLAGRNDLATRIRPILQRVLRKLDDQTAKENAEAEAGDDAAPENGEAEPQATTEGATSEETTA